MWNSTESINQIEDKNVLVKLDAPLFGSLVHVMCRADTSLPVIAGRFYYDAPRVIGWKKLIED